MQFFDRAKTPSYDINDVRSTPVEPGVPQSSSYEVTRQFINGLSEPVTVVDRSGMAVTIPCSYQPRNREFIVRVTVRLSREVKVNVQQVLNGASTESQVLAEVFNQGTMLFQNGWQVFRLDYHVTPESIREHGGNLYLTNLDLVVSVLNPDRPDLLPQHPFSDLGVRNGMVENDSAVNNVGTFGYSLRVVDSAGAYGERFVNINNQIYKVPVLQQSGVPDGVYLVTSGPVQSSSGYSPPVSRRYSFEEADQELGLYRSIDEARTLGDAFAAKERELQEYKLSVKQMEERLKHERLEREAEFDRRKRELDAERMEDEARIKRENQRLDTRQASLKEELAELEHRRSLKAMERKEAYETRTHERKDTSEVIKFLPMVVTGVMALFVAFQKAPKKLF